MFPRLRQLWGVCSPDPPHPEDVLPHFIDKDSGGKTFFDEILLGLQKAPDFVQPARQVHPPLGGTQRLIRLIVPPCLEVQLQFSLRRREGGGWSGGAGGGGQRPEMGEGGGV